MLKYLEKLHYVNIHILFSDLFRFSPSPYSQGKEKYTDWSPTGHPEPSIRNTINEKIINYSIDVCIIIQKKVFLWATSSNDFCWQNILPFEWQCTDLRLNNVNFNYNLEETNFIKSETLKVYLYFFKYHFPSSIFTIFFGHFCLQKLSSVFFSLSPWIEIIYPVKMAIFYFILFCKVSF